MIPAGPIKDASRLSAALWTVAQWIARHMPRMVVEALLLHVWDQATAEKYGAAMFEDVSMDTVFKRVLGHSIFIDPPLDGGGTVTVHLNADPDLSPETLHALGGLVEAAVKAIEDGTLK